MFSYSTSIHKVCQSVEALSVCVTSFGIHSSKVQECVLMSTSIHFFNNILKRQQQQLRWSLSILYLYLKDQAKTYHFKTINQNFIFKNEQSVMLNYLSDVLYFKVRMVQNNFKYALQNLQLTLKHVTIFFETVQLNNN